MSYEPSEEQFLKDVAAHKMTVLRDDGLYRCLRFRAEASSDYWFELVTWPNRLCITGDMGTWVFARLEDMFQFFRVEKDCGRGPNFDYWAEKIKSNDRQSGTRRGRGYTRRYIWCCRAIVWGIAQYDKAKEAARG